MYVGVYEPPQGGGGSGERGRWACATVTCRHAKGVVEMLGTCQTESAQPPRNRMFGVYVDANNSGMETCMAWGVGGEPTMVLGLDNVVRAPTNGAEPATEQMGGSARW